MSQQALNTSAKIANTIIEKILPWYKVEFIIIDTSSIDLLIAGVPMRCTALSSVPRLVLSTEEPRNQDIDLLDHLNGILSGKIRNDAGELVAKDS